MENRGVSFFARITNTTFRKIPVGLLPLGHQVNGSPVFQSKDMKKYALGEFEEIVLLMVGVLYDEAYGVAIKEEIQSQLGRKVSVGALQSALRRMEEKGFLQSRLGDSTSIRGGRPKRYFTITAQGKEALEHNQETRSKLWRQIPNVAFDF